MARNTAHDDKRKALEMGDVPPANGPFMPW